MTTTTKTVTATETLAREVLELHRLARAASEIRDLPSPATPREKNAKGAPDPTAGTALDPRRIAVADAHDGALESAEYMTKRVCALSAQLRATLDQWDGR
ncbi:hypothetical protein SMC26_39555 [Actinomadura fulvescens]|uniref:Uncharacterized protein n=1 Tax=Actinomadura fulvescens TaxID=46160 RepID=A0ABN3Q3H6_9ACTN